ELSSGIRVEGVTRHDVQAELWAKRGLVKTFGIRSTIHIFPSDELTLWLAALRARAALDVQREQSLGMDAGQLKAILEAIEDALDGQRLTLKQLGVEIVRRAGSWTGEVKGQAWSGGWPRWRSALHEAALAGILVYGPPEGNEVTFVRLDQWTTGNGHEDDPDTALVEVFRRYLRAYGPVTPRDFAQWFNIPPRAARDLAVTLREELEEVDVEGHRAYLLRDDVWPGGPAEGLPVRLLPHFDCYVIGCHPRDQLLPPDWAERVPPRTIPSQLPTLLVDGKVAGIWQRQAKGGQVEVRVEPFLALDARQQRELEEEAARIGSILGAEASLTVGPVMVRPHL
ncbi:MAG: winged helix DNA-binding domain-containing protein, partial [Chloroflexota bacterium]|nr:winged helix DNA-binding domain-containing protein [Chloroflexota bacterium]